jgi:hypothetical protein
MMGPPVYVFTAGEAGHYGLTLLQDGSNLPPLEGVRQRWSLFVQVTMASHDLLPFTEDIKAARAQLTLRGFYLARVSVSATVVPFPKTHRSSA